MYVCLSIISILHVVVNVFFTRFLKTDHNQLSPKSLNGYMSDTEPNGSLSPKLTLRYVYVEA